MVDPEEYNTGPYKETHGTYLDDSALTSQHHDNWIKNIDPDNITGMTTAIKYMNLHQIEN